MNLRSALLAGILALVSTALRAEELQVTVSGVATCVLQNCNPQTTPTGPFTVSYDVNTLSGTRTTFFQPNELGVFEAESLSITNLSEIVDGHTILSALHTTGSFEFIAESRVNYQFTGGAGPLPGGSFAFEAADPAVLTEAQFKAFKDPLADMLLLYRSPPGESCGVDCELFPSELTLHGTMTVTRVPPTGVPAPEPLSLLLAGLVGLVLSRRRGAARFFLVAVLTTLANPYPAAPMRRRVARRGEEGSALPLMPSPNDGLSAFQRIAR